jgi:DNA-binding NarL/FixJ family response regulator
MQEVRPFNEVVTVELRGPLTVRQSEVLRCMALGLGLKESARTLDVTLSTIKNHLATIYDKLEAHNLAEALRTLGWLRIPGEDPPLRLRIMAVIEDDGNGD